MAYLKLPIDCYNFKAFGARHEYAQACREQCRPDECTLSFECWAARGTADSLYPNDSGAPRCRACDGKVKPLRVYR